MKRTYAAACVLCLVVTSSIALASAPKIDKPAPVFSLRDMDGALHSLMDLAYPGQAKRYRPKQVVVLDFFRTDCKPCRKSLPKLVELHKRLKGKAVRVMLVALLEEEEGQEKLERFLSSRRLPFPVLVDSYAVAGKKYVEHNGDIQIPALFVIDRQGVLRAKVRGVDAKELAKLHKLIEDLLQ